MAVRAHLANDHTMFRQGLEAIFATRGDGIEVVGWIRLAEKAERAQE
jgi:DNA-binding NarL/FixJ family response regulator